MTNADPANEVEPRRELPVPRGLSLEPLEPTLPGAIVLSFSLEAPELPAQWQPFTRSERSVLSHLLSGATNRRIAAQRGASERTVANQVASIFRKLCVHSRLDVAVVVARRQR